MAEATQRITYATMSADPNLHTEFDAAIERVKGMLGKTYPMYIDGRPVTSAEQFEDRSPTDTRVVLGTFQKGGALGPERPMPKDSIPSPARYRMKFCAKQPPAPSTITRMQPPPSAS